MKSRIISIVAVVVIAVVSVSTAPIGSTSASTQSWFGEVTLVEDGDTFYVDVSGSSQHIRVAGLNTNEVNRSPKCYADEATVRLKQLIDGRQIELRATNAGSSADGRLVRHVFLNGQNIAETMLREGYGTPLIFLEQGELDYAGAYLAAYAEARRANRGINDHDQCGAGPRADFPVRMTTNGDADGSDYSNVNGEWVRLRNDGASAFDLTGWQLKDSALEFYAFPNGTTIAPGGVLTVYVGQGSDSSVSLFMGRTSPIFSGADGAFLLDPDGDIRAQNTWPCVGLCGDEPVPDVTITGLNYDIPGNDDLDPNGEWFDLRNDGTSPINLLDWRFESFPHVKVVTTPLVLNAGATVRIRIGEGSDTSSQIFMNRTGSILNNTGDVVLAVTPAGDVAACQSYGDHDCRWHPSKSATMRSGADFNGDGWSDLVGGAPTEGVGSIGDAGALLIRYGRSPGVRDDRPLYGASTLTSTFLSQSGPITGGAESGDEFGAVSAFGDFNGDGYDDIAIGAPGEAVGSKADAGVVHVISGSAAGISATNEFMVQPGGMVPGAAVVGGRFGAALASGDVNGDGLDDLIIGQPGDDQGRGSVSVLYGFATNGRVTLRDAATFSQSGPISGAAEPNDEFGAAVAAGDFDRDGYDDVAVGVPGEALGSISDAGLVQVLWGTAGGVVASGDTAINQGSGVVGYAESNDRFGEALAAGDFDGDGYDDLAVGSPGEALGSKASAGAVIVAFGQNGGLGSRSSWLAQSGIVPGYAEAGDRVGASLAAGDVNDDGRDDLAIGSPGEAIGSRSQAGLVGVVFGPLDSGPGSASIAQGGRLGGAAESGDQVGAWLDMADHDGDGHADVIIGVPGEDLGSATNAGLIHRTNGADGGVGSSSGLTQSSFGAGVESGDRFGS